MSNIKPAILKSLNPNIILADSGIEARHYRNSLMKNVMAKNSLNGDFKCQIWDFCFR